VPARHLVHRRTAVWGVAATFLVAGCDHGDDIGEGASSPSPSTATTDPTATGATTDAPAASPDQALVDAAVEQLTAAYGVLVTARRFEPLRQPLAPLIRARRRHVEVLDGEVAGREAPVLADAQSALRAVRRSETQLQAALAAAAATAQSGALARLLASISASATQHLAVLPEEVG
jgi:hypothetical protein